MKKTVLIIFLTLIISCKSTDNNNPNIVLFFVDDLGWTDLSFMGSKYYETPNIDNLSKSGMTFYNGYASAAISTSSQILYLFSSDQISVSSFREYLLIINYKYGGLE